MGFLITCKPDYEQTLLSEIGACNTSAAQSGRGWVIIPDNGSGENLHDGARLNELCFACNILRDPVLVQGGSVNDISDKLVELFTSRIRQKRIDEQWPFLFFSPDSQQLIQRAKTVQKRWKEKLIKKVSRVAKLSYEGIPYLPGPVEGFFTYFIDLNNVYVSFKGMSHGQARMRMDEKAPSRSFLKLEEAFRIFGVEPQANDTVVDLGAAPGGWSYSVLRRGAKVTAVDNGPLRPPVSSDPGARHLRSDALAYKQADGETVDWLLCDILEKPEVIINLLRKWLSRKWCRWFIVNLKVGRADPVLILKKVKDSGSGIAPYCELLLARHLYHDREEITLMGKTQLGTR